MSEQLSIKEIIDIDRLIAVQEKLADLTGISVVTVDRDGTPISRLNNFSPVCQLVRSTSLGMDRCIECDRQAIKRALAAERSISYNCHVGLKDCCVPIVVKGEVIGAVLGGQVLLSENDECLIDVDAVSEEFAVPKEKLREAISKIPVVAPEYLQMCIEVYELVANYSKEMGLKYLAQQQVLEETREKMEYENRAKYAELKSIEAQINPHFLFNTLNSIARMAMFESATVTEEMIFNLSDLLRYNLKQKDDFPEIEQEIKNIHRYLLLQKMRYQERLEYSISVDEGLENYLVPAMIIQPIVENAIIHGLEPLSEGGRLEIIVKKYGDDLHIYVKDTGVGFTAAKKKEVLATHSSEEKGLGFLNSHLRIQDIFGKQYGAFIEEDEQFSTIIKIIFPAITYKEKIKKGGLRINEKS